MCVHSHHARPAARQGSALQPRQAMSFAPAGAPSGAERAGCAACPKRVCNLIVRATLYSIDRMRAFMIDRSWVRSQRAARPAGKGAPVGAGGRRRARGAVPTALGTLRCAALGALLADIDACVRIDNERARIHGRSTCVRSVQPHHIYVVRCGGRAVGTRPAARQESALPLALRSSSAPCASEYACSRAPALETLAGYSYVRVPRVCECVHGCVHACTSICV